MREQIALLKECIFKLFHYSDKDGTPLENLLDMNNKNIRIKRALEEAFSTPHDFYTEHKNFKQQLIKGTDRDNIVSLTNAKKEKKRTLADDFQGRF